MQPDPPHSQPPASEAEMTSDFVPKGVAHVKVAAGQQPVRITFVLLQDFSLIAFSSAIEPLRIANQLAGRALFEWQVLSETGEQVRCSNGLPVVVEGPLAETNARAMVFVCAGVEPDRSTTPRVADWLRHQWRSGRIVGGLCSGAYALAKAGILEGRKFTLHWENLPPFAETFPHLTPLDQLYCIDGRIMTCAGGAAATDLFIDIVARNHGPQLADAVLRMCLHGPQRPADLRQRMSVSSTIGARNPLLVSVIETFEKNIETPVDLEAIADDLGVSLRQIQRLFKLYVGISPKQYLMNLRLERARALLTETEMTIVDISASCGFEASNTFSKAFRRMYGVSPSGLAAAAGGKPPKAAAPKTAGP